MRASVQTRCCNAPNVLQREVIRRNQLTPDALPARRRLIHSRNGAGSIGQRLQLLPDGNQVWRITRNPIGCFRRPNRRNRHELFNFVGRCIDRVCFERMYWRPRTARRLGQSGEYRSHRGDGSDRRSGWSRRHRRPWSWHHGGRSSALRRPSAADPGRLGSALGAD